MNHLNKSRAPALLLAALTTVAQPSSAPEIENILVTGSRFESEIIDPARQITVLNAEDIQAQLVGAVDVAQVLAQSVPGKAPASQTLTNYSQTLRGRKALVLLDGVPLNTNRNSSQDLYNVDPEQTARIEIMRGGNALYGSGATGGVIAITTKRGRGAFEAQSRLSTNTSLTKTGGDASGYKLAQSLSGEFGGFDYALSAVGEEIGAIRPEPVQLRMATMAAGFAGQNCLRQQSLPP